ncbi:4-oxalocrotonate tautomerase [Zhongshania marina]|uniref:4-oxalocrotonate tautomerase n=1 Tax=Zhongshania marina TaxID=2304603 RepID=A0A2S4HKH2_9GAMM|nr:4-oxalocrotonate tautomerase [Marortus luteolus]POP54494.1 4-oxalocrotonate tautomerase [Marortus luteolus]
MPVIHFHIVENTLSDDQCSALLVRASKIYSTVLNSPMERVRAFIKTYRPELVATSGNVISEGGRPAPYFEFIVLEGRPLSERHELMKQFSNLIAEVSGVELSLVRGACWPVPPEDWGIGSVPASELRKAEIDARR